MRALLVSLLLGLGGWGLCGCGFLTDNPELVNAVTRSACVATGTQLDVAERERFALAMEGCAEVVRGQAPDPVKGVALEAQTQKVE